MIKATIEEKEVMLKKRKKFKTLLKEALNLSFRKEKEAIKIMRFWVYIIDNIDSLTLLEDERTFRDVSEIWGIVIVNLGSVDIDKLAEIWKGFNMSNNYSNTHHFPSIPTILQHFNIDVPKLGKLSPCPNPNHEDKKGSFSITKDGNTCYCQGCEINNGFGLLRALTGSKENAINWLKNNSFYDIAEDSGADDIPDDDEMPFDA